MIRLNILMDEKLINTALKITKIKTRKKLIEHALKELLRHEMQKKIIITSSNGSLESLNSFLTF